MSRMIEPKRLVEAPSWRRPSARCATRSDRNERLASLDGRNTTQAMDVEVQG